MITINQIAAKLNRDSSESLIRNIEAMPVDKAEWKALELGRSALNQVQECAVIAKMFADTFSNHAIPAMEDDAFGKSMSELDTVAKAVAALRANTENLVKAIEAFPAESLEEPVQLPWEQTPNTFAAIMFTNYWNSTYHEGQINFIQTLYSDKGYH